MVASRKYFNYIIACVLMRAADSITRLPCQSSAHFSIMINGMADKGDVANTTIANTARQCTLSCVSFPTCKSLNYRKSSSQCELLNRSLNESKSWLQPQNDSVYMTTDEMALNVGTFYQIEVDLLFVIQFFEQFQKPSLNFSIYIIKKAPLF